LKPITKIAIICLFILSLFVKHSAAQTVIVDDDFSKSAFPEDPPWFGDTSDFEIFIESENPMLRLRAGQPGSSIITTPSEAAFGTWEFFIRQDFTPSNSNFAYIFLMSDRPDLDGNVNGYAIRTGEGGSPKRFRLFRFTDGTTEEILSGRTEITETDYRLKVERDLDGVWTLFVSQGFDSEPELDSDPILDATHNYSSNFGLWLNYTSTRTDRFYFDDIRAEAELLPFQPVSVDVLTGNSLIVTFNHLVDSASLNRENFVLDGLRNPDSVTLSGTNKAELIFNESISEEVHILEVRNIADRFGNLSNPNSELSFEVINPFFIKNATTDDDRSIKLIFSDSVNPLTVSNENFRLQSGDFPKSVSFTAPDTLLLNFAKELPGGENQIKVDNISSDRGWEINRGTIITFFKFDEYEAGDVIINEFMYRPPEDIPTYVELFNRSNKYLNLKNWRLQRRQVSNEPIRIITDQEFLLEPESYLVISADTTSMTDIYGKRNWFQADNFPRLNVASNDEIRIFTESGTPADSLEYNPSLWGGNGVALERLSPDVPARFAENWSESPNPLLGTPGLQNDAATDRTPPVLVNLSVTEDGHFILEFNERLAASAATDKRNYSITPSPGISLVIVDINVVTLIPERELADDTFYTVTAENIEDLFGNKAGTVSASVRFFEFAMAAPGDLVVNEILYRPASGEFEFVEIFNRSNHTVNLTGWQISSENRNAVIQKQAYIRAGDYAVLTQNGAVFQSDNKFFQISGFPSFRVSGDAVTLKSPEDITIDSLFYRPEWGGQESGSSLERRDPSAISTDPSNWSSSKSGSGSTAGEENSVFEIDSSPPEVLFATYRPQRNLAEVRFTEFVRISDETAFLLNGAKLNAEAADNRSVIQLETTNFESGKENILQIVKISDFQGNSTAEADFVITQPLTPGGVVINEIMFDPIRDNFDNLPDQSEYIEIINREAYTISLEGIVIHDHPDENGEVRKMTPVSSKNRGIPPGGHVLLYADNANEQFRESGTARFFELKEELSQFAMRLDRATLSLSLSGRPVFLADSTGATIDLVNYSGDWHNPNIVDTKGISLERINPGLESNDPANWSSSSSSLGGTPLRQNSLFQNPALESSEIGLTFEPNPFSPDGDGQNDNLFIRYKLDEPDFMMRVRIFDRYGRLIRKLTDTQIAGLEGTLLWDGLRDDGQRNRIGIYIVLFEAFNSANGSNRTFKETVVIARKMK
jgi:hypothetical protein